MTETITIRKVEGLTDLYCKYPQQSNPQDCFLEIDPDQAQLRCDYNSEIGSAMPMHVWNNLIRRYTIPCLRAKSANELMETVAPLAEKLIASYECVWDGSNNVGRWDRELSEQFEELIRHECEDRDVYDTVLAWEAGAWYESNSDEILGLRADMTDAEITELADKLDADSVSQAEADLIEGTHEELIDRRDRMQTDEIDD